MYYNNNYNNNNVSSDILATGAAVSTGIASYYQGKSQAQLAKKNPTAYLQLKRQQNRIGLIILFVFLGLFDLAVIIIIIVVVTSSHKQKDEETTKTITN